MTLRPSGNDLDCRVHDAAVCAADRLVLRVAWPRDDAISRAERREAAAACAPSLHAHGPSRPPQLSVA